MTPRSTLRELFSYNDWARDKVVELAANLSDAQLDRPVEMGFGTLRNTLHHLWAAERVWLDRWLEKPDIRFVEPEAGLPIATLRERFRATAAERDALLDRLGPDGPRRRVNYRNMKGDAFSHPLGDLVLHVSNHGVHHRAQALNLLRHSGVKPPMLDYIIFRCERPTVAYSAEELRALAERGFVLGATPESPAAFDVGTLRKYFSYGDWANARLYDAAATLDDDALNRRFELGLGSLRKTLLHIYDAEDNWLKNWTRGSTPGFDHVPEDTSLSTLREWMAAHIRRRTDYLETQTDADLQRPLVAQPLAGIKLNFRLGEPMLTLGCHGTHHRAQAVNMLRHVGVKPPGLDYVVWLRERE